MPKTIHLVLFGGGHLSSRLIKHLQHAEQHLAHQNDLILKLPIIADKNLALVHQKGPKDTWKSDLTPFESAYGLSEISAFVRQRKLKNLIAIDATNDNDFLCHYADLLENGFHLISTNTHLTKISSRDKEDLQTAAFVYDKQFIVEDLSVASAKTVTQSHKVNLSKSCTSALAQQGFEQKFIKDLIQLTTHLN